MTQRDQIYYCSVCHNTVEVIQPGGGTLVCCGENMKLLAEKTSDGGFEKHVPVIEKIDGGYKVTVGSTKHPMIDEHYIVCIELHSEDYVLRKYLHPGDEPVAVFMTDMKNVSSRIFCNIHGVWLSKES